MEPSQASARPIEQNNKRFTPGQIIEGIKNLNDLIKSKLEDFGKVYLIALSRKMPRVIYWATNQMMDFYLNREKEITSEFKHITRNYIEDLMTSLRSNIEKCVYTTELALPVIFDPIHDDYSNSTILVLDDIVITGETVNNACDDIYYITGEKADFWCFSVYKGARMPDYANKPFVFSVDVLNREEAAQRLRSIVDIINEYGLPSDIEFPILHLGLNDGKEVFSNLNSLAAKSFDSSSKPLISLLKKKGLKCYALPKAENNILEKPGSSFTILTGKYDVLGLTPGSIEKIRIFKHKKEYRVALFAPKEFSDPSVKNKNLFSEDLYKFIWQEILEKIDRCKPAKEDDRTFLLYKKGAASYRFTRLKAITANYLSSLSIEINRIRQFIERQPETAAEINTLIEKVHFDENDLQLLFGEETALAIIGILNRIIHEKTVCGIARNFVKLPDTILPKEFFEKYIDLKHGLIKDTTDDTLGKDLLTIMSHSAEIIRTNSLALMTSSRERMIHETIAGFIPQIAIWAIGAGKSEKLKTKEDVEDYLNKWLDENIDNGYLIPRWQKVVGDANEGHWRRYFHVSNTLAA